jgi:hypothetical protein
MKGGEFMNKKIIMSALSIVSALTITGGATYAAFFAEASNTGNSFASGELTMDLLVDGSNATPAFSITNAKPGDVFDKQITLRNTGSMAATSTSIIGVESTSAPTSPDLSDKLLLTIYNDLTGNGLDGGDPIIKGPLALNDVAWETSQTLGFGLASGLGTHAVIARVTFDPTADNTYQGKSTGLFKFNFRADQ